MKATKKKHPAFTRGDNCLGRIRKGGLSCADRMLTATRIQSEVRVLGNIFPTR